MSADIRSGAVTVGNFDGVHRGHLALLDVARSQAQAVGGPAVAVTFDPHPVVLLNPAIQVVPLTLTEERVALLRAGGVDHVVVLPTTQKLLALEPEEFFQQVLREQFGARVVVEGLNFCFGRNRRGDCSLLEQLCRAAGMTFVPVPPVLDGDLPISSSRIRTALLNGDVTAASRLLGRPYRIRGTVATGMKRGRTLGFPTANLVEMRTLVPRDGVYAARVEIDDNFWPAAVNVGPNPTFGESTRKLEAHLIGFSGDLYGREIAVEFVARLRDTRPFGNVQELIEQVRRDVNQSEGLAGGTDG